MPPKYSTKQMAYKRRRLLKRAAECGNVSQACREFGVSRKTFYKWRRRYEQAGRDLVALQDHSRRPHRHPRRVKPRQEALICRLYRKRRWKGRLVRFWHYLSTKRGVRLTVHGVWKVLRRAGLIEPQRKRRRKPKPYQPMSRPGERLQIDTKHLDYFDRHGNRIYQYTAIDEFSRWRFLMLTREITPLASIAFLEALRAVFPFPIECVQTDHGTEFTYAALPHVQQAHPFQAHLESLGIRHKLIKIATPRHNGKVERSHRTDEEEFYRQLPLRTFSQGQRRLERWNHRYNRERPHGALGWKTPCQVLKEYAHANNLSLKPKCYR
jgi:transposase InsO family protein